MSKDNGGPASDRELLEMAAIACGEIQNSWRGNDAYFEGVLSRWNPLTDDGDALRLAVELKIDICFGAEYVTARGGHETPLYHTHLNSHVATRRAIVRAAAAIGEQMQ